MFGVAREAVDKPWNVTYGCHKRKHFFTFSGGCMRFLAFLVASLTACAMLASPAKADFQLPVSLAQVAGSPIRIDGCTASRGDSPGGYLNDYYVRGNASFTNLYSSPATEVDITIHFQGAYGNHDALVVKRGNFAPGVRVDPKRRAWIAMLQPYTTNIDVDGSREIDIWGTVSATCEPMAAEFADGTVWNIATGMLKSAQQSAAAPPPPGELAPAKCAYDAVRKEYVCPQ